MRDALMAPVGTRAGHGILDVWASFASHPTGANDAQTLIAAAQHEHVSRHAAAALIGPQPKVADMLNDAEDIAYVIRRWESVCSGHPTWWRDAISLKVPLPLPPHRTCSASLLRMRPLKTSAHRLVWLSPQRRSAPPPSGRRSITHHSGSRNRC